MLGAEGNPELLGCEKPATFGEFSQESWGSEPFGIKGPGKLFFGFLWGVESSNLLLRYQGSISPPGKRHAAKHVFRFCSIFPRPNVYNCFGDPGKSQMATRNRRKGLRSLCSQLKHRDPDLPWLRSQKKMAGARVLWCLLVLEMGDPQKRNLKS